LAGGDATRGLGYNNFDPNDARQWTRELNQRLSEIQDIRNLIGSNDPLAADLNRIMNAIRAQSNGLAGDPNAIAKIAQSILDPLRSVELELSQKLQLLIAKDNVRAAQEEDIPTAYKPLVEEYYKRLSNQKQ